MIVPNLLITVYKDKHKFFENLVILLIELWKLI